MGTKFIDSEIGKWVITIIPGILAYVGVTKDFKIFINNVHLQTYQPLIAAIIVWSISLLVVTMVRKLRRKFQTLQDKIEELHGSIDKRITGLTAEFRQDILNLKSSVYDLQTTARTIQYDSQLRNKMLAAIVEHNINFKRLENLPNSSIAQMFSIDDLKYLNFSREDIRKVFPEFQ